MSFVLIINIIDDIIFRKEEIKKLKKKRKGYEGGKVRGKKTNVKSKIYNIHI